MRLAKPVPIAVVNRMTRVAPAIATAQFRRDGFQRDQALRDALDRQLKAGFGAGGRVREVTLCGERQRSASRLRSFIR
ncbi:MAG: hypothetical protein PVH31_05795 [Ectothiorhodospiraceae bacterium]|jgi:hypothetical protein